MDSQLYDKIEAYLHGDLNVEDKKAFEADIANNPQLAEQVEMQRFEWDGMEVILEDDLRGKMAQWQDEEKQLAPPASVHKVENQPLTVVKGGGGISRRLYYGLAAAASIVALISALFWVFTKPQPVPDVVINRPDTLARLPLPTPMPKSDKENAPIVIEPNKKPLEKKVETVKPDNQTPIVVDKKPAPLDNTIDDKTYIAFAEEAYEKSGTLNYEDMNASRGNNNTDAILDEAGKAYDKKDFTKTIALLRNTPIVEDNFMALELLAHAQFHTKNYKAALPVFQKLLEFSGKKSRDKSEWYLLLCYIANYKQHALDFKTLANKILENKEHTYFDATTQLLKRVGEK